jgi:outer membrane protease
MAWCLIKNRNNFTFTLLLSLNEFYFHLFKCITYRQKFHINFVYITGTYVVYTLFVTWPAFQKIQEVRSEVRAKRVLYWAAIQQNQIHTSFSVDSQYQILSIYVQYFRK